MQTCCRCIIDGQEVKKYDGSVSVVKKVGERILVRTRENVDGDLDAEALAARPFILQAYLRKKTWNDQQRRYDAKKKSCTKEKDDAMMSRGQRRRLSIIQPVASPCLSVRLL